MNEALGAQFADERLQIIRDAVNEADTGPFLENSAVHFDNSAFTAGSAWITGQWSNALRFAGLGCMIWPLTNRPAVDEALREFGLLLHTVQDFYSHSNFIEKGGRPPLGRKFESLQNLTGPDGTPDPLLAAVVDAAGKAIGIKTGRYLGNWDFARPSGNCWTEAAIRDLTSQCNHWDMNKDTVTLGGVLGRPKDLFWQARNAAVDETIQQWSIFQQKIRAAFGNPDQIITWLTQGCDPYIVKIIPDKPSYTACTAASFRIEIYDVGNPQDLVDPDTSLVNQRNPTEYFQAAFDGNPVNLQRVGKGVYSYAPGARFRQKGTHRFGVKVWRRGILGQPDRKVGSRGKKIEIKLPPAQRYKDKCGKWHDMVWDPNQCKYVKPQPPPQHHL